MHTCKLILPALALALTGSAFAQDNNPDTATPINTVSSFPFDTNPFTTSGFNGGGSCGGGASSVNKDGFWQWTAPAPGDYTFDTFGSSFDTKLSVHLGVGSAASCADYNDDTGGLQSEVSISGVSTGDMVLIQVGGWGSSFGTGTMTITHFVDPCAGVPDDAFEDNDDCATASAIGNGANPGLFVSRSDPDFYSFCVANGATLNADLLFTSSNGDIDCFLRSASSAQCGTGNGSDELAEGFSATDNENLVWTNTSGSDMDVVLEVNVWTLSAFNCNTYDLVISGAEGCAGGTTGVPFCNPANVNSTGTSTVLAGSFGSGVGSDLHLECIDGVPGEFGYMLVGNMATAGIPVSQGRLCLVGVPGAQLYRYNISGTPANSIGQFDASGVLQNIAGTSVVGSGFDVPAAIPSVLPVNIAPGETWHFQVWHRDTPAGPGISNLSNGLSVTF